MASGVSENPLELELTCPICLQLFCDPVTLFCGHSFCLRCLEMIRNPKHEAQHHCPECRVEYQNNEFHQRNLKLRNITEVFKATIQQTTEIQKGMEAVDVDVVDHAWSSQKDESNKICNAGQEAIELSIFDSAEKVLLDKTSKHRSLLTPLMTDIHTSIEQVDYLLAKAKEKESAIKTSNADLRADVRAILNEMVELLRSHGTTAMELLDAQLKPREDIMETKVKKFSDLHDRLKDTEIQVNTLLEEQDDARFNEGTLTVKSQAAMLLAETEQTGSGEDSEVDTNLYHVCKEIEQHNYDLRLKLGLAQRRLRNILNPSEVTFDPDTVHPNLVLSEDLKMVSFSAVKQTYPARSQRFTSLFQALSSQSFSKGEHCWILQAECCPWVMGLCYGGLPRSGSGSSLESSRGSWCLMWFNNILKAYDEGRETPLQLRTPFLQKLEICLSFSNNSVTFSSISNASGAKTHIYTFSVNFTEPVHLAVRMMSGQPKAQIALHE